MERPAPADRAPPSVHLEVTSTEEAVKGRYGFWCEKAAVLETGVTVMVPLFVKKATWFRECRDRALCGET